MAENVLHLPHTWVDDIRQPSFTVSVPQSVMGGALLDVYMAMPRYWIAILFFVHVQIVFSSLTAYTLYKLVVLPKRCHTTNAMLLCYGAILPFWIVQPSIIIPLLGIRHFIFRFVVGGIVPNLSIFRTLQTVHGFTPSHDTKSLRRFFYFFVLPMAPVTDKNGDLIKATAADLAQHSFNFIVYNIVIGIYKSWLQQYRDWSIFTSPETRQEWYTLSTFVSPKIWCNAFFIAFLFLGYLALYCEGLNLFSSTVTGYRMITVMHNPVFASASPSDFWGRRWNMLVHSGLKNGVYKPVRKTTSSHALASLAAFVASGLMHEWLLLFIFIPKGTSPELLDGDDRFNTFPVVHGGSLVFFGWQAALVAMEGLIGHWKIFERIATSVPRCVSSLLIVLAGIPTAYFFQEPYVRSGFFDMGMHGVLTVRYRP